LVTHLQPIEASRGKALSPENFASGLCVWDNNDPFGNSAPNDNPSGLGSFPFDLRFPGQVADAESGLNYNWWRWYDASIGRYPQSDPKGLIAGTNTYAYANGAPLQYIDPFGLDTKWSGSIAAGGATYIGGGQGMLFDLTSECKCNKIVTIKGFASFVSLGIGAKLPILHDAAGGGGHVEMSTIWDCPSETDANGPASAFGINVITPLGGASYLSRVKLGRLSTGFHWADGPMFGADVSATMNFGASAVTSSSTKPCCSK
jgi:RHS repeat-associated protein